MCPAIKTHCVILLCLLYILSPVQAATHAERKVDPEQWQRLVTDKAFNYKDLQEAAHEPKKQDLSAIQKLIQGLFDFFGGGFGNALLWIIVIGVVGYIFYKLFISADNFLFRKNKRSMAEETGPTDTGEDITSTNWELLLQKAMDAKDARMAVRYSYMWLLQILQRNELINYRIDKTNYDYYLELNETDVKQPFKRLSRQYEYVWYGKYPITETACAEYMEQFDHLKRKLG